jgi:tetratricopeptide (TPR) repeat protein
VARAEPAAAIDGRVARAAANARTTSGVATYAALREVWRQWDQVDPAQVEAAIAAIAADGQVAAPARVYAGLLDAYARRRRGDLDGARRRLRALGMIDRWLIVGPFDNEAKASLATPFGPEEDLAGPLSLTQAYEGKERPVRWRSTGDVFRYGWLDLGNAMRPSEKVCGYASTFVRAKSKEDVHASLWIGAGGSFRAFWNASEVLADTAYRALDADRFATQITLRPGWNRLTVKVCGDEEGPLLQARIGDANGGPLGDLEYSSELANAEEASRASAKKEKGKRSKAAPGVKIVAKGDPYAKGAKETTTPASAVPPPWGGPLAGLARTLEDKKAAPELLEACARYLALTGGDEKGQHTARDLASRAAESHPTTARLLLAADLAEDRNVRAAWIKKARAGVTPGERDLDVTLAEALLARGGSNFRDATPYFDRVLAEDPSHVAGILGRAELYEEAGLKFSSLATVEDAVRRVPHSISLLRALARQYRAVGRATDAEEVERRYANYRFDDVAYLRDKVDTAVARRDVPAATRWIERLLDLEPDAFGTVDLAARSFRALGNVDRALALYEKRLELTPEDVDALRALAEIHGEEGRKDKQLDLLRKILVLRPQAKDVREYVEHAQPPKIRRDEAFAWEKDQLLELAKQPPSGSFPRRSLRDLQVTTVYPNGLAARFHQVVFQPLTDEGAAAARQYAFSYQAGREVVDLRAARVYRKNGVVDEAIETGESANDNPAIAMYTSARTFYVQLPKLTPGDVVELRYRVEEVTPRNEFGDSFSETAYLQGLEPTSSFEYVLITPIARKVNLRRPTIAGFTMEEKDEGELHVARFVGTAVPPVLPEPSMPPLTETVATVSASTFTTWDEVGKWFWGLAKDQFDIDDDVRKKVAEITKGLTTDDEKVRAVYDWVVQRTRYVALEFGIEGFRPRRCAQTISRGWGDCKDKATVIVAMLKELGIPANIVLVRTQMRGDTPTDPPAYAIFDHAIAYVPKLDLFLDGTAEYTGSRELPPFDRGAIGLIVSEGGAAKLVRLPDPAADATVRARKVDVTISEGNAPAMVDLSIETTGALAAEWRQRYHAAATQKGRVVEDMGGEFGGLSVTEKGIDVSDLERIEAPVKVHVKAKALGLARGPQGDLSFAATAAPNLSARYASLSQRHHEVKLPFQYGLDDEWTVHLPAGATFKHVPEDKIVKTPFGRAEISVERSATKIVVRSKLRLDRTRIKPEEYAAFRQFCEEVDRTLGDRVVVGK